MTSLILLESTALLLGNKAAHMTTQKKNIQLCRQDAFLPMKQGRTMIVLT